MRFITFFLCYTMLLLRSAAYAGPLINEISAGGSSDWIEIALTPDTESCDISRFFITMYYGTNESVSSSPVTIRNRNIPETPYDDRFAVIHFTSVQTEDETDLTGDTNGNGVLDLYCCNYGLWNTDCVVAIDSDDNHANGGILDFAAFSNRDGSINSTIAGYITAAAAAGEWESCAGTNLQDCAVYIGADGLNSYSSISRTGRTDTNTCADFAVTSYSTPGKENIFNGSRKKSRLFHALTEHISHRYGSEKIQIPLFLYESCSIRIRLFSSTGITLYSPDLEEKLSPGYYTFSIPEKKLRGRITTGIYPLQIEAAGENSSTDRSVIYIVISRKR